MRIGELSETTGVATRLLRYYEEQGLISADRAPNGYRDYDAAVVDRVTRIRGMLRSGLTTRFIRMLLDMEGVRGDELAASCTRTVAAELRTELAEVEDRIACLERSRDTLQDWLGRTAFAAA